MEVPRPEGGFDSERLRLARELRGMRKIELAEASGLSAAAISQYEAGEMVPRSEALARLALALAVPREFLVAHGQVPRVEEHEVHFRRLRSTRTIDRRRVLAQTKLLVELAGVLQRLVELPSVSIPRGYGLAPDGDRSAQRIEAIADALRAEWSLGLGPISDMVRLLESKGVFVTRVPSETKDIDAFSVWIGTRPLVVLSSDKEDAARSRFDASHELGHLVLHHDEADPTDRQREVEAHLFASAFLMPATSIARELPVHLDWSAYLSLKARWKVSLQALLRRARDLGRLTNAQYRRAITTMSARGQRLVEPGNAGAPEEPYVLPTALRIAATELATTESVAGELRLGVDDLLLLVRSAERGETSAA